MNGVWLFVDIILLQYWNTGLLMNAQVSSRLSYHYNEEEINRDLKKKNRLSAGPN